DQAAHIDALEVGRRQRRIEDLVVHCRDDPADPGEAAVALEYRAFHRCTFRISVDSVATGRPRRVPAADGAGRWPVDAASLQSRASLRVVRPVPPAAPGRPPRAAARRCPSTIFQVPYRLLSASLSRLIPEYGGAGEVPLGELRVSGRPRGGKITH